MEASAGNKMGTLDGKTKKRWMGLKGGLIFEHLHSFSSTRLILTGLSHRVQLADLVLENRERQVELRQKVCYSSTATSMKDKNSDMWTGRGAALLLRAVACAEQTEGRRVDRGCCVAVVVPEHDSVHHPRVCKIVLARDAMTGHHKSLIQPQVPQIAGCECLLFVERPSVPHQVERQQEAQHADNKESNVDLWDKIRISHA
ncbi:hypothetical protein F7725_006657 [Dissostichus mawsoni]|uniref:Uncharacterized protein n=1 Tax=Dissostichus mawsoni TaxID=36200 RepID=A0A7J5XUK0_DISMA|nr:hypothetical protein F7725_006657 [Dissostichus mawsoni]